MNQQDFSATFCVPQAPEAVFQTILNVRDWWSGLFGEVIQDEPGGFRFEAGGGAHVSRQRLVEVVPARRVVWEVTDSRLTFVQDEQEWTGSRIGFALQPEGDGTQVTFTHAGLTPALACYDQCSNAWSRYLHERLLPLLNKTPVLS